MMVLVLRIQIENLATGSLRRSLRLAGAGSGTAEHYKLFTGPWRKAIPYKLIDPPGPNGLNTVTATLDDIKRAARKIYKDYPEILQALGL